MATFLDRLEAAVRTPGGGGLPKAISESCTCFGPDLLLHASMSQPSLLQTDVLHTGQCSGNSMTTALTWPLSPGGPQHSPLTFQL